MSVARRMDAVVRDPAAALVVDGAVVAAAGEERDPGKVECVGALPVDAFVRGPGLVRRAARSAAA